MMYENDPCFHEITPMDVINMGRDLGIPASEITPDIIRQVIDNVNAYPNFQHDYRVYLLRNALISGRNN